MPLSMIGMGQEAIVSRIQGKPDVKKHLENLGFVPGTKIIVISENNGDLIVNVKETRVAINKEMANKIFI